MFERTTAAREREYSAFKRGFEQGILHREGEVVYLRAEIAKKDDLLVNMVREGYSPQLPPQPLEPLEDTGLPKEIMIVIDQLAEPRSGHWMELVREALEELELDHDPVEIAAGIKRGGVFNPYG